jgi:hypothetical protein
MAAQPGVTETVDSLVCDGKTLRGSIDETASGAARFIAQVSLYSNSLGVAIAQSTYATDVSGVGAGSAMDGTAGDINADLDGHEHLLVLGGCVVVVTAAGAGTSHSL